MIRVLARRSLDVTYFTRDPARELDGIREGGPGWWLRGRGDPTDPAVVAGVLASTARASVVGYDLVVAAPRAVSVLLTLDEERASAVVSAHRVAVGAALDYIENRAVVVRERAGGETRSRGARWASVVAFTHGVNRHAEPHLHDHVLVGSRPEGADVVLDARALVAHASAADSLYRATLRHEVARRAGYEVWRSFGGVEHVSGLDEGYRALWPGRHAARGEKTLWERRDVWELWQDQRRRVVLVGAIPPPARHRSTLDEHRFAGAFEGRLDVARRHVVAAWADAAVFGQGARDTLAAVDSLYPELRSGRGVHEVTVGVPRARMLERVLERGARPLDSAALEAWAQRSRSLERFRERSR
ncbi:MAG TPA: relaxase domain-containing protein [Acidimicrobiales bacterium]|nr:relaxase domain-containing protein [Acidimicrobiales bacterium]